GMVPWVLGDVLLEIGPVPAIHAERTLAERRQALLRARVAADVQPERVERGAELLDLDAGRLHLRLLRLPDEAGADEGHQEPDDHHDHHDLDQREARPGLAYAHDVD